MKAIIFDLYDTVLKDEFFDFNEGLSFLHGKYFSEDCSEEDFQTFALSFVPLYQDRAVTNKEVSFLRDEYKVYCQQLEVEPEVTDSQVDYEVMNAMQKESLLPEVKETLEKLHAQKIPMYILSNAIFTAESKKRLLKEFGILHLFKEVWSSADFGMRKPDISFFNHAIKQIQTDCPGIELKDIIFVGNDYDTDIKGALNAGLTPIWYNVKQDQDQDNLGIKQIKNFTELL